MLSRKPFGERKCPLQNRVKCKFKNTIFSIWGKDHVRDFGSITCVDDANACLQELWTTDWESTRQSAAPDLQSTKIVRKFLNWVNFEHLLWTFLQHNETKSWLPPHNQQGQAECSQRTCASAGCMRSLVTEKQTCLTVTWTKGQSSTPAPVGARPSVQNKRRQNKTFAICGILRHGMERSKVSASVMRIGTLSAAAPPQHNK
jgi:hypothetical protein